MTEKQQIGKEHRASAKSTNLSVSTKHSIEISKSLRFKNTTLAKKILEDLISLKRPIPFKTHNRDTGHKAGMAAGRFPIKAAREFLSLINSVEANAQAKGLNTSSLKISKLIPNKASTPLTGGRRRRGTKRTHLEIEVVEEVSKSGKRSKKSPKSPKVNVAEKKEAKEVKKEEAKEEVKKEVKTEEKTEKVEEVKKTEEKVEEVKKETTEEVKTEDSKITKEEITKEEPPKEKDVSNDEPKKPVEGAKLQ